MIPDHMPSMDDPVVLELVLCLLEAQGDKFSQLTEKPADVLPYIMVRWREGGRREGVEGGVDDDDDTSQDIPRYPSHSIIHLCIYPSIHLFFHSSIFPFIHCRCKSATRAASSS